MVLHLIIARAFALLCPVTWRIRSFLHLRLHFAVYKRKLPDNSLHSLFIIIFHIPTF